MPMLYIPRSVMETEDICCNTVRLGADGRIAVELESGVGLGHRN